MDPARTRRTTDGRPDPADRLHPAPGPARGRRGRRRRRDARRVRVMPHVADGATWAELQAAEPDIAARGRALVEARGRGTGLLATVRDGVPPRIHPMSVEIVEGHLLTVVLGGSAKARDIESDGRYALHSHQDAAKPDE